MKIALFHNYYQLPGGEDAMFELEADALTAAGHEVTTFSRDNADELAGASPWRRAAVAWKAADNRPAAAEIRAYLEREKPDISHIHNWFPLFSPSIYAAHADAGVPVVQTLHNYRLGCANATFRRGGKACRACSPLNSSAAVANRCYRGSLAGSLAWKRMVDQNWRKGIFTRGVDAYLAPSAVVANVHVDMGLPTERLRIVPNACEDWFSGSTTPSSPDPERVLFLGRLVPEKGAAVLLEAWAQVIRHRPTAQLQIVGDGPQAASLKETFGDLGGVQFRGQVDRAGVRAALEWASLVVFPGLWEEPFGLGVIEAMAAGRPVIASNLGGPAEILGGGGLSDCLVPAGEPAALASKITNLLASAERRRALGRAARAHYSKHFTTAAHAGKLLEVYAEVLEHSGIDRGALLTAAERSSA